MTQTTETLTPTAASELLRSICNPDHIRSAAHKPWNVSVGEETYAFASDGRRALYIECALPGLDEHSPGREGDLSGLLRAAPPPTHAVDRADLLAAIPFDGEIQADEECPDCFGDGEIECNLGHDHDCPRCDGLGHIDEYSLRGPTPIVIEGLGFRINAVLLRGILRRLPGATIQASERPENVMCFRGPGWIFLIASLNGTWPDAAIIPSKPIEPEAARKPA